MGDVLLQMSERDAELMRGLLVAMRNARGAGGISLRMVPGQGLVITGSSVPKADDGVQVTPMRVKSVEDEYLVCRTWDGEEEGTEDINVAKPYELRRSSYDGLTIDGVTYTHKGDGSRGQNGGDSGSRVQTVGPAYVTEYGSESVIYALAGTNFGSLASIESESEGVPDTEIEWLDINVAARRWEIAPDMSVQLTGSTSIADNRWSYTGKLVKPNLAGTYEDVTGGWTGTLYNTIEANNAAAGVQGSGDNASDFPAGVALQPLGAGAVVRAWRVTNCNGDEEVHFEDPNNPGGSCESGGG